MDLPVSGTCGVIGVFFVIPVLAAFVLSFTDFDIYALGNWDYIRFVGFKNYLRILDTPLFWTALKNTFYLRRSSADRSPWPSRSAPHSC
jgi:ABC-type sugar transport system permease subunit